MTNRLLAFCLVLGLLPAAQLVASIAGSASAEACAPGERGDICPPDCCPMQTRTCHCHDHAALVRTERALAVPLLFESTPATLRADHVGRRLEPPPVRPPIS